MKTEYTVAFLTKNSRRFNETDYPIIQKMLEKVDDSYFPLLLKKKFIGGWWMVLSIVWILLAIICAIGFGYMIDIYGRINEYLANHAYKSTEHILPSGVHLDPSLFNNLYGTYGMFGYSSKEALQFALLFGFLSLLFLVLAILFLTVVKKKQALRHFKLLISQLGISQ